MVVVSVSGIRGIVGESITPIYFVKVGRGFAEFLQNGRCLVGRDTRSSSDMLANAIVSGLMEGGITVVDLGLVSTPSLFREMRSKGCEGAIMITSSHNPPEWNGVKFIVKDGRGVFEEELNDIICRTHRSTNIEHKVGKYFIENRNDYLNDIVTYVGKDSCSNIKVALDPGGGAGCIFTAELMKTLGCKVSTVNYTRGIFPRTIDPTEDSLNELAINVKSNGCDIGFAFDSDADRMVIVDEEGKKLAGDYTLMVVVKYMLELRKIKKIMVSVDTSVGVNDLSVDNGAKVYYSKVGEANVVRGMMESGCIVGGEGSSGGVIISDFSWCRDGVLASALIARLIKEKGSLNEILKELPKYYQLRKKIPCDRLKAMSIVDLLMKEEKDYVSIDGVKRFLSNHSWVLIRPSGTENSIRISIEAETKDRAESIMAEYMMKLCQMMGEA